jgi:GntP family gluconate:H+ symporter
LLIIRWQVHAFVAMMLVSCSWHCHGHAHRRHHQHADRGMGGTLGSVAILVALGSMLGRMIEVSGGAASQPLHSCWAPRVPMALTAAALVLAIPCF